jgi:hypothetical protein
VQQNKYCGYFPRNHAVLPTTGPALPNPPSRRLLSASGCMRHLQLSI